MAKLSAHGVEVGRIEYIGKVKAYFTDGKVLVNEGHGWKVAGKLKAGLTPESAYQNAKDNLARLLSDRPALADYRRCIMSMGGIRKRWKLVQCLQIMPSDPEGIWSHYCIGYCDKNVHANVDQITTLCRLYELAVSEGKALKESAIA